MNFDNFFRFVNDLLVSKHPQLKGQTGAEEREAGQIFAAYNEDDRILQSCLRLRSRGGNVVLYTADKNLANKSLLSGIDAYRLARQCVCLEP